MSAPRPHARSAPSGSGCARRLVAVVGVCALGLLAACGGERLEPAATRTTAAADAEATSGGGDATTTSTVDGRGVVIAGGDVTVHGSGGGSAIAGDGNVIAGDGNVIVGDGNVVVTGGSGEATGNAVVGSGVLVTEDRPLSGFHAVELHGFGTVRVTRGDHDAVRVRADDNVVGLVRTEVRDGRLVVGFDPGTSLRSVHLELDVTAAALDAVQASGSGRLEVTGLAGGPFSLELSGSGDAVLDGAATELLLTLSGSGDVDAAGLAAERATVRLSGSGEASVAASAALDAAVAGSGDITYHGTPATLTTSVAGSGEIEPA